MTKDVLNADEDPNGVSAALGLDDAEQEPDEETDEVDDDGEDDEDEVTLESLAADLAELRRDNAKLKREAAAARIAGKTKTEGKAQGSDDGETVDQARERGKEEARLEYGVELAGASIRAALAGIVPDADLDGFVDDLRLGNFVGEDGKPDRDAIRALKDRQAKITRRRPARTGSARSTGTGGEKSKGELMAETMTKLGL